MCGDKSGARNAKVAHFPASSTLLMMTSLWEHVWGHVWGEKHEGGTDFHRAKVANWFSLLVVLVDGFFLQELG